MKSKSQTKLQITGPSFPGSLAVLKKDVERRKRRRRKRQMQNRPGKREGPGRADRTHVNQRAGHKDGGIFFIQL